MWHRSPASALASGLRRIDNRLDPEILIKRARDANVILPISRENISSPSLAQRGGQAGIAFIIVDESLPALRAAVDKLTA